MGSLVGFVDLVLCAYNTVCCCVLMDVDENLKSISEN